MLISAGFFKEDPFTFIKKIFVFSLGFLAFFSYARAEDSLPEELDPNGPWMICHIAVDGLKNIRAKTVTKNASAKKGEFYERLQVSEDIQSISALGNFNSVEIDITPTTGTRKTKEGEEGRCSLGDRDSGAGRRQGGARECV